MSNSNDGLSALIKTVTGKNAGGGIDLSQYLRPVLLADTSHESSASSPFQTGAEGLKSLSTGSIPKVQSISFGKPSSSGSSVSSSSGGSSWESLLSNTLSGGASGLLGNGISGFSGIGGLVSDIAGLFGGSSKPAVQPLTLFSLPDQQEITSYVNGTNATSLQGTAASGQAASSGIYSSSQVSKSVTRAKPVVDGTAVVQAVKNALLTSSTLADVITEI